MTSDDDREAGGESGSTATRILDASEELFAERGFAGVSVREIAARVGLNQASIYNHFPSKQALYEAVLERGLDPLRELLASAASGPRTLEAGDVLLVALVEQLWSTPNLPKLVAREILDDGEVLERLWAQWLRPIYEEGRLAMNAAPEVAASWNEAEMPFLVLAMYQLLFGHFFSAALSKRILDRDPFSPELRRVQLDFLKRATRRLIGAPDAPEGPGGVKP